MKKKLLPLFAVAVTACGGPEVRNRELSDIPGLKLFLRVADRQSTMEQTEFVELWFNWTPRSDDPCYRIPANTRLTVNGATIPLKSRGDWSLSFDGVVGCEEPWFSGTPRPLDDERVEYLLSDGRSRMRAVFQNLNVERRLSGVNGQEQATLRAGDSADVEWSPATDQLEKVDISLWEAGSGEYVETIETFQLDGNHIHFTLPPVEAGHYTLIVYAEGQAGVEACEGFSECRAYMSGSRKVSIIVE